MEKGEKLQRNDLVTNTSSIRIQFYILNFLKQQYFSADIVETLIEIQVTSKFYLKYIFN